MSDLPIIAETYKKHLYSRFMDKTMGLSVFYECPECHQLVKVLESHFVIEHLADYIIQEAEKNIALGNRYKQAALELKKK